MRQLQDEVIGPGIRFLEEEAPSLCAPSSQTASHKSESLKAGNGADLARSSPPLGRPWPLSLPHQDFFPRGQRSSSVG